MNTSLFPAGLAAALRRRAGPTSLLALALALTACASPGPRTEPTPLWEADRFELGRERPAAASAAWWQAFGDAQLDRMVERGLADHPGLAVARARVAQAQASAESVGAARAPQAKVSADALRQRYTENGLFPPPIAGATLNSGSLQLSLGWEFDFFGRREAEWSAALGQVRAGQAEEAAARNALAGAITRSYLRLAQLGDFHELAERSVAQREDILALTRQREQAGLDSAVERKPSEAAVPDARLQLGLLDEQIALARHQLAALSTAPLADVAALKPTLAALKPLALPDRLGANLLGQRADITAARWRVQAAGQQVVSARAQFYPDVNLRAFIGLEALGLDRWLELGSRQLGAGPALSLPLFDGGRLRAQLGAREAEQEAAVALYNNTVLDAVREARDSLATVQAQAGQQAEQARAEESAHSAWVLALQRQQAGVASRLSVLAAESPWLLQRRQAAELQGRSLIAQAQLLQALGGGWQEGSATPLALTPEASRPSSAPPSAH